MKLSPIYKLSSIILIIFLFFSCGSEKPKTEKHSAGKADLIRSYPQGKISPRSEITVIFNKAFNAKEFNGVIELSPYAEGKTYRSGKKSITFQPSGSLEYNKEYKVTVNLDKIFGNPAEDVFVFDVKTLPLTVSAGMMKISPVNLGNAKYNKGEVTLLFSEAVDKQNLAGAITVKQNGTPLPFNVEENSYHGTYDITVDSVIRYTEPSKIVLSLDMKKLSSEGEYNWTFDVNSLKEFDFVNWELVSGKEKMVALYFSDPIDENQNLSGLIYFTDNTAFDIKVEKNILKLYLQGEQTGAKTLVISPGLKNINN